MTSFTTDAPRTHEGVIAYYRSAQQALNEQIESTRHDRNRIVGWGLFAMVLLSFVAKAPLKQTLSGSLLLLEAPIAIALIWVASKRTAVINRSQRLISYYDRNLQRSSGEQPQSGRTGLEPGQNLRLAGHLYDGDLDLLGEDSLFGLLATVRTGPGERGLANYLLEPATHAETLLRQSAVQELLPNTELREQIALLGTTSFHQISASFFDDWLDDVPPAFAPGWRPALLTTAVLNVVILFAGLTHFRPWSVIFPNLGLTLLFQGVLCFVLRPRVLPLLNTSARLQQHVKLISEGLALLQQTSFTNLKLGALQRTAREPEGAVEALNQLQSHLSIVEQRPKEYFFVLSLFLAAGTQAAISISRWKRRHAASMRQWLTAWSEFEALNAVATYAFEHPEHAWPELLPATHAPHFAATALSHPLLANAVSNDISLGAERSQFYLISGSNMAGKSTLLRSIGINAVLAYAGAPVRAASLALTPLTLGASLALTDSLAEGRSKFLAEVERLSAIVTSSRTAPVLFLVDEIFSGTNSEDRRTAARAVLETLLRHNSIGALSTHDLALTELANEGNTGLNVHMASPNPEDPLAFDYKLKPGINTASNALAIVRMMGLDLPVT